MPSRCDACGARSTRRPMSGPCTACGAHALLPVPASSASREATTNRRGTLAEAKHFATVRSASPLGAALGGRLPRHGVVLLSGEPGAGKSTNAARVVLEFSQRGWSALQCNAEMNDAQTRDLYEYVGATPRDLDAVLVRQARSPADVDACVAELRPRVVVVDSLHALCSYGERAPQLLAWRHSARALWIVISQSNEKGEPSGGNQLVHNAHATVAALKNGKMRVLRSGWSPAT